MASSLSAVAQCGMATYEGLSTRSLALRSSEFVDFSCSEAGVAAGKKRRSSVTVAGLKDLRDRIATVKNTQKITDAMKLVAAAKVRRAQEAVVNGRPFSENLVKVLYNVNEQIQTEDIDIPLTNVSVRWWWWWLPLSLSFGTRIFVVCLWSPMCGISQLYLCFSSCPIAFVNDGWSRSLR